MTEAVLLSPHSTVLDYFFTRLRHAERRLLLLDCDSVVVPSGTDNVLYPEIFPLLDALLADDRNRVVLVSGRWTRNLLAQLRLRQCPEIWGCHGWERLMPDGRYALAPISETAVRTLVRLDEIGEEILAWGGRYEQKPASITFYWNGVPDVDAGAIRAHVLEAWMLLGEHEALCAHEFDGGIEFRAPGRDRAFVVNTLLAETGDEAAIAYLGGGLADECAFLALIGHGIPILVQEQSRATAAIHRLTPPAELLSFLRGWLET